MFADFIFVTFVPKSEYDTLCVVENWEIAN